MCYYVGGFLFYLILLRTELAAFNMIQSFNT